MIDQRQRDLINAAIDDELDAEERAEFDALLEASAEARKYYEDLCAINDVLDAVPQVEPSDGFGQTLLERIRLPGKTAGDDAQNTAGEQPAYRQDASLASAQSGPVPGPSRSWFPLASRYALARYAIRIGLAEA